MPNLLCIDGIPVSGDEKAKAEMYFIEQQVNNNSKKFIVQEIYVTIFASVSV